jgi:hypothetical protein
MFPQWQHNGDLISGLIIKGTLGSGTKEDAAPLLSILGLYAWGNHRYTGGNPGPLSGEVRERD